MSRYNRGTARAAGGGPLAAEAAPSGRTYERGAGYARDARSELFLRAAASFAGEDSFYEGAAVRDDRLRELVAQLATDADGFAWLSGFVPWLRAEGNMRTAPVLLAAEAVHARLAAGLAGGNRQLIAGVLRRADEPGEMLAYWRSRYGRAIPQPVKRGVADAALALYREYPLLKYDTGTHGIRFADVLALTHPGDRKGSAQGGRFAGAWQHDLFAHAIDRRYGRGDEPPESLAMIAANQRLRDLAGEDPSVLLDAERLRRAGMTWEDVLSLAGSRVSQASLWTALLPSLGYMALIRNLRNLDEAGISDADAARLAERIADPEQVRRSRQLPFRFLSARLSVTSLRWDHALEKALDASLANIPELPGRTLVLIDTSASMSSPMSGRSQMSMVQAAALFGLALAVKNPGTADVWGFADGQFRAGGVRRGASVLKATEAFCGQIGRVGHGTQIAQAVTATYHGQDRVVILTDMQTFPDVNVWPDEKPWRGGRPWRNPHPYGAGDVSAAVPAHIPVYGFNLVGYPHGAMPAGHGNRHELGGLTDRSFAQIGLIERGARADWPWVDTQAA
jgi:TROVE domain